jgi:nucleotide-binding universal stress UspA family protein
MATITREPRAAREAEISHALNMAPTVLAPILVATDGTESADHAIRAARAIADHTGQPVELLAVHEPLPMLAPEASFVEGPAAMEESRTTLKARVLEQVARVNPTAHWPLQVVSGQPEAQIAHAARKHGASLVIMGLGEHGLYERLLGDEMVLRVIRLGTVPVLAVAPGFLGLPKRILAATDFSPSSVRALTLAESITTPNSRFTIAHVLSNEVDAANWKRTNAAFHGTTGRAFDLVVAGLKRGLSAERELLVGNPAKGLLEFAKENQTDLIVTGSHGFGFLTRLWLGSVSQRLVRGARCSVLVAPPQDGPSYVDELPAATTRFASYEWAERLEEFTRRNAGRSATMEVIDPDLGAQIENHDMPLLGVDFDARDASIHVMLGDDRLEGRHLTRTVRGATAVQVLRTPDGRDLMLRVAHGRGQTLVTFDRKA